jgi:hypothetical protein
MPASYSHRRFLSMPQKKILDEYLEHMLPCGHLLLGDLMKNLFVAGGRDYRTAEEKFVDRLVEDHQDGQHKDFVILDCPKCDEEQR